MANDRASGSRPAYQSSGSDDRWIPNNLPFETTAEVKPLIGTIGQPRAIDAIEFGLEIDTQGYNLFVTGSTGSGRESTVLDYLTQLSAALPATVRLDLRAQLLVDPISHGPSNCPPDVAFEFER